MDKITFKLRMQFLPTDQPVKIKFSQTLQSDKLQDFHECWIAFLHAQGFSPDNVKEFYSE